MKARVYVSMKPTVLDPQGQTIRSALAGFGHTSIAAVRQGKYFDIILAPGTDREKAAVEMDQIAHDVLANPVIEEYRVEFVVEPGYCCVLHFGNSSACTSGWSRSGCGITRAFKLICAGAFRRSASSPGCGPLRSRCGGVLH